MRILIKVLIAIALITLLFTFKANIFNKINKQDIKVLKQKVYLQRFSKEEKIDINNDGLMEKVIFNDVECDLYIDENTCSNEDQYIQITLYDEKNNKKISESERFRNLNSSNPDIFFRNISNTNYIFVGGLDRGAHSSSMVVLRQDGARLVHVCRLSKQKNIGCNYWSDAGGPYLEDLNKDGVPEIVEEGHTYSENNLEEIVVRNFTEILGTEFVTTDSESRYVYFLDLYKHNKRSIGDKRKVISIYEL